MRANGYTLALSAISHQEYGAFLDSFPRDDCAGLVVIATELERADILRLSQIPIPIVILDSDHPGLPFPTVTMNNRDLAYQGVEHLRGSGAVGYLYSKNRTGNFVARGEGYAEALCAHAQPIRRIRGYAAAAGKGQAAARGAVCR